MLVAEWANPHSDSPKSTVIVEKSGVYCTTNWTMIRVNLEWVHPSIHHNTFASRSLECMWPIYQWLTITLTSAVNSLACMHLNCVRKPEHTEETLENIKTSRRKPRVGHQFRTHNPHTVRWQFHLLQQCATSSKPVGMTANRHDSFISPFALQALWAALSWRKTHCGVAVFGLQLGSGLVRVHAVCHQHPHEQGDVWAQWCRPEWDWGKSWYTPPRLAGTEGECLQCVLKDVSYVKENSFLFIADIFYIVFHYFDLLLGVVHST